MQSENRPRMTKVMLTAIVLLVVAGSFGSGYLWARVTTSNFPSGQTGSPSLTLVDDAGRLVSIPQVVGRIVTLAPSSTELAFSVGLGDRVVCVDNLSDYPPEVANATRYPRIGTYPAVNLEALSACEPDLVLAAGIQSRDDIERMEASGFVVFVLEAETISGILQDIRLLGLATGLSDRALSVARGLQARVDTITSKTTDRTLTTYLPRVYIEYFPFFTFGPGSFGNDLVVLAGGRNIAGNATNSYPQLSSEFIIATDPEIIVYTTGPYTQTTKQDIVNRVGWNAISAVKSDKIFTIDDNEVARPGPRIVDALESLAHIVHPELFS